jgi:E3 ubiquitin-protein ligase HUWE1
MSPDDLFNYLCEHGKIVLNILIKEKLQEVKNILNEPLGVIFLKQPKIIDFENKQKYFKQELKALKS